MIIDFHTHCFPDKLAQKAIPILSQSCGGVIPQTDGTLNGLKKHMKETGVDISCVMNIATNPHQMKSVNNFAKEINSNDIISFGSIHPDALDWEDELDRIAEMGLKGVKLHPDYQEFMADDERMKPIYRKISELGLVTLFHAGFDYGFEPPYHCMPDSALRALSWFESPVVLAHWGGIDSGFEVIEKLCGLPVYFDTSFGYGSMPLVVQKRIIEKHGTDKLLFGSDCPWHSPAWEMRNLSTLGLSDDELEKIYHLNAEKLLNI